MDAISDEGDVVFDTTVFYAESGGQVGDSGTICAEGVQAVVDTTIKAPHKQHLSHVIIKEGELRVGDAVELQVDEKKRDIITSNHSCTAALSVRNICALTLRILKR